MRTTAVFVWAMAFLLSGCVSTPYQPLEAANRQKIKTIGLVSVPNPEEYQVTNFSSLVCYLGPSVAQWPD